MSCFINSYRFAAAAAAGAAGDEFRIRPITAGKSSNAYMRLAGIEFLSSGTMPGGYTAFGSGFAAGNTAYLFDGDPGSDAAISIDGSSNVGVTYPTQQIIDTVRLTGASGSFNDQYAREWVLESRAVAGTGLWVEVCRYYTGQYRTGEVRSFSVNGDANPLGYQYYKVTIVSNFGGDGTNTWFCELGIVDEDGTTEIQRDFKTATNFGGNQASFETLFDLSYANGSGGDYDVISGIPADVTLDWGRKKKPSKLKIGFRDSPYQGQGPDRVQVHGSNDSFATSTLLLDTGSTAAPTGGEVRTFTIP